MQKNELSFLTVLRALAAFWVSVLHAFSSLSGLVLPMSPLLANFIQKGWIAVDLFFILSGFILSFSYEGKTKEFNINFIKDFLLKRVARLYPAHLFTLLLFVIMVYGSKSLSLFNDPDDKFNLAGLFAQIFLIHGIGFFKTYGWNVPSWSISSEMLAYIIFPLVLFPLRKIKHIFLNLILISSVLLMTIWLAWKLNDGQKFMLNFEYSWIRVLSEFIMGIALFHITKLTKKNKWYALLAFTTCGCIYIQGLVHNSFYDFMYLIYFMVIIHSLALIPYSKKIPLLSTLGEISYSLYLVHSLVIIVLNQLIKKLPFFEQHPNIILIVFIIISQCAAWIIYSFVEIPGRNYINGLNKKIKKQNFRL